MFGPKRLEWSWAHHVGNMRDEVEGYMDGVGVKENLGLGYRILLCK